jgi:hypothetical protein
MNQGAVTASSAAATICLRCSSSKVCWFVQQLTIFGGPSLTNLYYRSPASHLSFSSGPPKSHQKQEVKKGSDMVSCEAKQRYQIEGSYCCCQGSKDCCCCCCYRWTLIFSLSLSLSLSSFVSLSSLNLHIHDQRGLDHLDLIIWKGLIPWMDHLRSISWQVWNSVGQVPGSSSENCWTFQFRWEKSNQNWVWFVEPVLERENHFFFVLKNWTWNHILSSIYVWNWNQDLSLQKRLEPGDS